MNILKKRQIDENNNQNGAISLMVLFTVFMFLIILMGLFITVNALYKSQLKSDMRIQEVYGKDVNQIDKIYDSMIIPYDTPYIPTGFTHIEGSWNGGYVIRQTSTGNEFVWVPCVLNQDQVRTEDTVVTFEKITTGKYNELNLGLLPKDINVEAEDSSVEQIRTSVGKYGGFYIARYEAGIEGTMDNDNLATKTATDGSVKPLSQKGKGLWNYISRLNAITVSKAMINTNTTGVKSTLISGECWDTTLQWIVNASENKETNKNYDTDSTGKGNYTNQISTTGYYKINNIYDMAGNEWEWTTENCQGQEDRRAVIRGGYYNMSGYDRPSSYRSTNVETLNHNTLGFRVVLYK